MTRAISVAHLSKRFGAAVALRDVSLTVQSGEMVALIGASGSGKSTLLRNIAGLTGSDPERDSSIEVLGTPVQSEGAVARDIRRARARVGFVFQQFNLVGRLPVLTNVLTGLLSRTPAWRRAIRHFTQEETLAGLEALARVGMADRALQRASTLSGGQQQRAAIARTLVQQASVILADEPIASLDPNSARRVMDILTAINREDGVTVLVSLHQVDVAIAYCPRTVALAGGRVVYDGPSDALTTSALGALYGSESCDPVESPVAVRAAAGDHFDVAAGVISLSKAH
ncbi:MAG: phosphonate ABC transporter ATP-binding protein [Burkholderiales bacterium]